MLKMGKAKNKIRKRLMLEQVYPIIFSYTCALVECELMNYNPFIPTRPSRWHAYCLIDSVYLLLQPGRWFLLFRIMYLCHLWAPPGWEHRHSLSQLGPLRPRISRRVGSLWGEQEKYFSWLLLKYLKTLPFIHWPLTKKGYNAISLPSCYFYLCMDYEHAMKYWCCHRKANI